MEELIIRDMDFKMSYNSKDKRNQFKSLKKILMIGPKGNLHNHFLENLYEEAVRKYDVKFLGTTELNKMNITTNRMTGLSNVVYQLSPWKPDLILIDQDNHYWTNITNIPVFYHHREFHRFPNIYYPNVAFFWTEDVLKFYEKQFASQWMDCVQCKKVLYPAINPKIYVDTEKSIDTIVGIGGREPIERIYEINELTKIATINQTLKEINEFKSLKLEYFDAPLSDLQYRELLSKCKKLWFPIPTRQYITRRMLDAMTCNVLCIFKLENKRHEEILENMGFINGQHYIGIKSIQEIEFVEELFTEEMMEEIVKNAKSIVFQHHTFKERLKSIIKTYHEITSRG